MIFNVQMGRGLLHAVDKKGCVRELFCAAGDHAVVLVVIHAVVIRSLPAALMAIFRKRNSQHIAFCQESMTYD